VDDFDKERIRQLEQELGAVRLRLKSEQSERSKLWPKAELSNTYLELLQRARRALQEHRSSLVGVQLRVVDLLLFDIARAMQLVEKRIDQEAYQNQPCFACGASVGTTEAPEGRYRRCNACGYAG
jgi:DNA-directed RNA polymerase subunit RPC12/RpoP